VLETKCSTVEQLGAYGKYGSLSAKSTHWNYKDCGGMEGFFVVVVVVCFLVF
jgi:hypothetical protein